MLLCTTMRFTNALFSKPISQLQGLTKVILFSTNQRSKAVFSTNQRFRNRLVEKFETI